ncbi:MAG: OmpA family protein [Gammaproteobacteria bacterium]
MTPVRTLSMACILLMVPAAWAQETGPVRQVQPGESAERHLSPDEPVMIWAHDPERLDEQAGDRIENQDVVVPDVETVKLRDVVPPIRFESGVADIPSSYITRLREVLDSMQHLRNVRLHMVGHADSQPLSPRLAEVYGDNAGLSRERAGEVAEFIQAALALPPEAISFEWAGDSRPLASNATEAGRALNRRVEVEVWYDEPTSRLAQQDVVVPADIRRVKVCRMETVCKLRYKEGHARRARVKNLVRPLHYDYDTLGVSGQFIEDIRQALANLADKDNVTVRFTGHTDDTRLTGRTATIYGTHLALSKARARRVALAVQEALGLPTSAVESDGEGAHVPLASNQTPRGRDLNRRIEVEFWHDDPLQDLPDEPQLCPDAAGSERVTRVYDPPWGDIPPLSLDMGKPVIPAGYVDSLRRAMGDLAGRSNVRLRFTGYTGNERLDRRTAMIYGDDVGLSTARALRTMETVREQMGLDPDEAEHEGRGYVHATDVVNAGFIQGEDSFVAVDVVYDELAVLDDYEGVDVTRITRELATQNPLGLNLMRITVDGEPVDDPGRSSSDVQRCTDVALDQTDIRFRFDNLESLPRLSVTARPSTLWQVSGAGDSEIPPVRFRQYTNYGHFIDHSEVRVFDTDRSTRGEPLAVLPVAADGYAEWQPEPALFAGPARQLRFVLRAYDAEGRFDETEPQPLWLARKPAADDEETGPDTAAALTAGGGGPGQDGLLAGYGESDLAVRNIVLGSGTVSVTGSDIPPGHSVWVAGQPVPTDGQGNFAAEIILPTGMHTVEVAVLDENGSGELFLRDLEFKKNDWFYTAMADLTLSENRTTGAADELEGENTPFDYDSAVDGRLAFYVDGEFGEGWNLTASADTREAAVEDMFTNFLDKSPESLFRRIDPDYYYPTFGDDGTVEEMAPTMGKFYVKLERQENHALWGNFDVRYGDNELARVDRGLYGANLRYQSEDMTGFGEHRFAVDGFGAEPGTVGGREAFRGTGGSLYLLARQDLLPGSERIRIEIRDKATGIVSGVSSLRYGQDYDIDYLQGRILLSEPLSAVVTDDLLVRTGGLSGDEAWLVVNYEYTPGFDELDTVAVGGQGHYWVNDYVRLGLTTNHNSDDGAGDSSLNAGDVTVRMSNESWLKLQAAQSEGLVASTWTSSDGGFEFDQPLEAPFVDASAGAHRIDLSLGFADILDGGRGRLSLYHQRLEAGYSGAGLTALSDLDQYGAMFQMPVTADLSVSAKADSSEQDGGLKASSEELNVGYQVTDQWTVSAGVRRDSREDDASAVALTQETGDRTDAVVQAAYDSRGAWTSYGFAQETLSSSGNREDNGRVGVGGSLRLGDRVVIDAEASGGDLGPGGRLGSSYMFSDRTTFYVNYALENERTDNGLRGRHGNLVAGTRSRLSDSASVYVEERYQRSDDVTGLTHATGLTLAPTDRWNLGVDTDIGTLVDRRTGAETERQAAGFRVGYGFDTVQLSTAMEYRFDDTQQADGTWLDRTTWLVRNSFKYQVVPDWRIVGKFNHSESDSSAGDFYDGGFTEAVLGYAFRPVDNDRLNALAKYTYFYNVPGVDQMGSQGLGAEFLQKSHVAALDLSYDVTSSWSVGGKYAYRLGQVSLDRENPNYFDNNAHLVVLRTDLRVRENWEGLLEGRVLDLPDTSERRSGMLVAVYRYLGASMKVGLGYNFTDFSDDLTDLDYDHQGVFLNLVGAM